MKGRKWRLFSVVCSLRRPFFFFFFFFSGAATLRLPLFDTHEFLLCMTDSQARRAAEHGSGGGKREEDHRQRCQRNLGNIFLPTVPGIGKGPYFLPGNNNCCGVFIFFSKISSTMCACRAAWEQVCKCCQCPTVASSCWRLWEAAPRLQTTSEYCDPTRVCSSFCLVWLFIVSAMKSLFRIFTSQAQSQCVLNERQHPKITRIVCDAEKQQKVCQTHHHTRPDTYI